MSRASGGDGSSAPPSCHRGRVSGWAKSNEEGGLAVCLPAAALTPPGVCSQLRPGSDHPELARSPQIKGEVL